MNGTEESLSHFFSVFINIVDIKLSWAYMFMRMGMRNTAQIILCVFFLLLGCSCDSDASKWDKHNQAMFQKMDKENVVKIDYRDRNNKDGNKIDLDHIDEIKELFKKSKKKIFTDLYSATFNIVITMKDNERIEMYFYSQNVVLINGVYYDIPEDININQWCKDFLISN